MNNEKIGKFIRKLRKAKGLTQQQLGDLVNVGGKSVSKWERGLNMPDVSIINEVSKVLGITSDELLKGEFNKNSNNEVYNKNKSKRKNIIIYSISLICITAITILIMIIFNYNTKKYWLTSAHDDFGIHGYIEYNKKGYTIYFDDLYCNIDECKDLYLNNIKYSILINDTIIYMKKNNNEEVNELDTINENLNKERISLTNDYHDSPISYSELDKNYNKILIIIEGYSTNEEHFIYTINLKIDDKSI